MRKAIFVACRFVLFSAALLVFSGQLHAADLANTIRLSPAQLGIASSPTLPAQAQADEAAALPLAFDRSTTSVLPLYDSATVTVDLEGQQDVTALRLYNPSQYALSVTAGRLSGKSVSWSAVTSAQNIDLSVLAPGWNTIDFAAPVQADSLRLSFALISGAAGAGLSEIEIWGNGTHVAGADAAGAVAALGNAAVNGQYRRLSGAGATIGISANKPVDTANFDNPFDPDDISRVWLQYELRGVHSWLAVRRSVNGRAATGGYVAADETRWSVQMEEISPEELIQGQNTLTFGTLAGNEHDYTIRNLSVIVELDDGRVAMSGPASLRDGDPSTVEILAQNSAGDHVINMPLRRRSAVDTLVLDFAQPVSGQVTIKALQADGSYAGTAITNAPLTGSGTVVVSGSRYKIALGDAVADGLRVIVSGASAAPQLAAARLAGSPEGGSRLPEALTLTWPEAGEFYGRTGFLRGFAAPSANGSGAAELYVAGLPFPVSNGAFEVAISKDQAGFINDADDDPWSVDVVAIYPDGSTASQTVVFDTPTYIQGLSTYTPGVLSETFVPGVDKTVQYEEAELTVPASALSQTTQIRISALSDIEVAKLDAGLINVTKGPRRGYRMLPHMKFNAKVKMKVPYAANLIPQGYTDADVRVFYFDEEAGRWIALAGSVADIATAMVDAETTHFTDFIAGVVVAPESPQVASYNPTQFSDMKVADPSAKITLIQAPQASNSGDAGLSYPFELPPGRQGMAPQLGLQYSSAGGNGWTGLGWSMPMQEITIDTRWGVPRYSQTPETAGLESETYLLNGQQLTPLAHRGALVPRVAERVFHTRIEGGFAKIIRHGDAPNNYWWEVTDKMGTRYAYGGDLDTGLQDSGSVLGDANGNVFKWALTEIRDTNGNRVEYFHTTISDTGLENGSVPGRQLYCSTIRYTGSDSGTGPFEVRFLRDRDLPNFTRRNDTIIDGRGGFKMVTADLLKRVEITYNTALVRAYELDYQEGAFHKTLLQKVTQFDADNQAFNSHTFEYFDDARTGGQYRGFASATDWTSPDDNIELGRILGQDASALSGHEGSQIGWHLYVGLGTQPRKDGSIGVKGGGSSGTSDGRLLLIDLNGDGLSDKVFVNASGVFMRANESGPNGTSRFAATPIQVANLPALMREKSSMSSRGIESYIGINAAVNWADTVTISDIYFTDVNGDGLPDLNLGGAVLFNVLDTAGNPTFANDSSQSAYPIGAAAVDAATVQFDFDTIYQQMIDDAPLADSIRSWTAPFAGTVQITGDIALIEDTSPERAAYETADGVRVAIQHNGTELFATDISDTDYTPKTPGLAPITVAKGDKIYFRVQSVFDGAYDQVSWAPVVAYTSLAASADANGLANATYDAVADFAPFGDLAPVFDAPFNGTVRVSATLNKSAQTTDDVTFELLMNGSVVSSQTLAWNQTGTMPIQFDTAVTRAQYDANGVLTAAADSLSLKITTDSPVDLAALNWLSTDEPRVWYTASADPQLSDLLDQNGQPATLRPLPPATTLFAETDQTTPLAAWTATENGSVTVTPAVTVAGGNSALNTTIFATVKSNGALIAKSAIPVVSGTASPAAFSFNAVLGQDYFFEFSSAQPDILSAVSASGVTLTLPSTATATPASGFNGASPTTVLSQAYRGWQHFGYNGNRNRATQPISITASDLSGPSAAEAAALEQAINDAIANGQRDDALVLSAQRNLFPFTPELNDAPAPEPRWASGDEDLWNEAAIQSASRYGANFISVPDVTAYAGASAAPRLSTTSELSFSGGIGPVNGALSNSDTVSLIDFLDLNGDSFPDVVNANQIVQFSPMTGGLETAASNVPGMLGNPRASEGEAFSLGIGGTFPHNSANAQARSDVTAKGGSTANTGLQMQPLGISGSFTDGESHVRYDLQDMNADGLPDVVRTDNTTLWVRFNLGYQFGPEEVFGTAEVNHGESDSLSLGLSIGFNDGIYGFGGGLNGSKGTSRSIKSLADVNGDGLLDAVSTGTSPDTIRVRLNSGSGFHQAIDWNTGGQSDRVTESGSVNGGIGAYFTISIPIPFTPLFIIINPGADGGLSMNRLERSIQDIDGDGFPEFLYSEDDDELAVSFDTIDRTNLLKRVNRPLGSHMTLAYDRSGNTQDQPQNKWVLARVEVFDGFAGDGTDVMASNFRYEDGFWDREEREFYGYARVIEDQMNVDAPGGEAVYRTVTRDFTNRTYYEKGLLVSSVTTDGLGAKFLETTNDYRFVDIVTATDVAQPDSLTATVFPQLIRTDNLFYEGQPLAGKATYQTFAYDQYGNVTQFFDAANLHTVADDVTSDIGYHEDLAAYIVGKADSVTVTGNGAVMRERQANFAPGTGNMTQLRSLLAGGAVAISDFAYDGFGNLTSVTGPANATGQRYALTYTYDPEVSTYVTGVEDSFGYTSASTYDVRFGEILSTTDLNNQPTAYTLDAVGRIVTIQGPHETGSGLDTITFAYNPVRDVPGDTQYPDVDVSWALTRHIDTYRNPADPIETALFIDGLGRALQTKKDAAISDQTGFIDDRMTVSGRITFDHVGRQVEQRYPVDEALGSAGIFNPVPDAVTPTVTEYDILDRPIAVTTPEDPNVAASGTVTTSMVYDFAADRSGVLQFHTLFIDGNGNQRETFTDVRQLITSVKEINPAGGQPTIWTSYIYDPLRQITSVTDDHDNVTTAQYDNFGRMTVLDSPDAGRTTYQFDLASNLTAKQTANLAASGGQIAYAYNFNRLESVTYPDFADNNVSYSYGAPGAGFNRANRIVTVTSEAGTEERFYGPLGEMVKQIRTINSDTQGNAPSSPEIYTTEWTFDTWNRVHEMIYPDGEVLTNSYDSGGKLARIDGTKSGFDYDYLRFMGYDKFGQRTILRAGNGTVTTYDYVPESRRLDGLVAANTQGRTFQDLSYGYDRVGNILTQANAAGVTGANQLGGATAFTYAYDDLYRLTGATGTWEYQPNKTESFTLDMAYDTIHNIVTKDQHHVRTQPSGTQITQKKTSYDWTYTYAANQPHAPSLIGDRAYSYDANGNQTGWDHVQNGTRRTIVWDEENRIQEVADNGHTMRYKYDDAGERVIKRGPQGETAYVNQFFTMRNREVGTKHVFAGSTRLVSKLVKQPKDIDGDGVPDPIANCAAEPWGWTNGNGLGLGHANGNNGQGNGWCNGGGNGNNPPGAQLYEFQQYYFHPDHLGSSSYVTDADGEIFQHLEYFPFGETWVEESSNTQRTPYLFTGKELDEETQLYYFGARYYDPRTSVWQSPDPILQNYIQGFPGGGVYLPGNLALYSYTHQRPVIANDPEGEWINFVIGGIKASIENVVIQQAEIALGLRDEFSWGELAVDAALGTVTSGASTVKNAGRIAEVGIRAANKADDVADASRLANKADDAADIAQAGAKRTDDAMDARRTPRQSEQAVEAQTPDGRSQVSFKDGEEVPYGTKGSVRPDVCTSSCAIEVKNYDIANNKSGLIRNILGQVGKRADNLPEGMTQNIVIDVGGQNVSQAVRNEIRRELVNGSNGALSPSSIRFLD